MSRIQHSLVCVGPGLGELWPRHAHQRPGETVFVNPIALLGLSELVFFRVVKEIARPVAIRRLIVSLAGRSPVLLALLGKVS